MGRDQIMNMSMKGKIAFTGNKTIESYACEGDVVFGIGVMAGTDPEKQVAKWSGANDKVFRGIALFDENGKALYQEKDMGLVMETGSVWVVADGAVTAGEQAACYPSGNFGKKIVAAGTSGTYAANIQGIFKTSGADGELVALKIEGITNTEIIQK